MNNRLLLTPLRIERDLLIKELHHLGFESQVERVQKSELLHFPSLSLRIGIGGHGKVDFAIRTQFLIQYYQDLSAVYCAGCAGALDPALGIGDVILGEKTIEHDYDLKFITKPLPAFKGDSDLISEIRKKEFDFKVHLGSIASGDEDVVEESRAIEIYNQTQAIAVAWEGAGAARACAFNDIPFLEIRGVTDYANSEAQSNFSAHLEIAMKNLTKVLV